MQALSQYVKGVQFVNRRYLKVGGTFSVKDELSPHKALLASPLLLLGGAGDEKLPTETKTVQQRLNGFCDHSRILVILLTVNRHATMPDVVYHAPFKFAKILILKRLKLLI